MASLLSGAAGQRGSCRPLVVWQRRALSLPPAAATSAGGDPNLAVQLAIRRKEGTAPAVPEVGLGSRLSNQLPRATLDREISEMGCRRALRHDESLREWIFRTTLDCGQMGCTSVRLKPNRSPTRKVIDCRPPDAA